MSAKSIDSARCLRGFTMIEMVTVIIILGVLAVAVLPRLDTGEYRAAAFHDEVVSALRYAQKTATSHRRLVCVAFTAATVSLTIDHDRNSACDGQALMLPGAATNTVTSGDPINAAFVTVPTGFSFNPDGSGADRSLTIIGQTAIAVVGSTGYVR